MNDLEHDEPWVVIMEDVACEPKPKTAYQREMATKLRKDNAASREIAVKLISICADMLVTVPRKLTERRQSRYKGTPIQSKARAYMAWVLCEGHDWAYARAGRALGLCHTSVMAAVNRACESPDLMQGAMVLNDHMTLAYGPSWHEAK